jgi:hypothetical protein
MSIHSARAARKKIDLDKEQEEAYLPVIQIALLAYLIFAMALS